MGKTKIHTIYKLQDGSRVPGVTTILGILNKPALIHWAWKLGIEGIDYKKFRDDKADIGTLAHYLILCHFKNEIPDTSEYSKKQIDQAENCLISFYEWEKEHKLEPQIIEQPLVSEKYKYGGTSDLLAKTENGNILIDFKTGKGIYPEMYMQLAAYKYLTEEQGFYKVDKCKILRIGRNEDEGFEERDVDNLELHWELFLHCLSIYDLKKQIKKKGV